MLFFAGEHMSLTVPVPGLVHGAVENGKHVAIEVNEIPHKLRPKFFFRESFGLSTRLASLSTRW